MAGSAHRPTRALLLYPRFVATSFWDFRSSCEIMGKKYPTAPLGLITVAAMLPDTWELRLVDCNTSTLTEADLAWAEIALISAMLPQCPAALHLIDTCQAHGLPVCLGGPDPTSRPDTYAKADFLVVGEAEGAIDAFVAAWDAYETTGRFTAPKFKIDVTKTPVPRYDLLHTEDYLFIGMQFSRGCPFLCEFCDIIELYGRKPRTKAIEQVLAELQTLYDLGYRGHVDFVDDNLIGNKKALKPFLRRLIEWQAERGKPFLFHTEASVNLADDPELLDLMRRARFKFVFVGIESPDDDVLTATRKKQNARRDLISNLHAIQDAGIMVLAGFIIGFDTEKPNVARATSDLIRDAALPISMVGLLYALPNTQLTRRLRAEGRLHENIVDADTRAEIGDHCIAGLNFETVRPRADILSDYRSVLEEIYAPNAFFDRCARMAIGLRFRSPLADADRPREATVATAPPSGAVGRLQKRYRKAVRLRRDLNRLRVTGGQICRRLPADARLPFIRAALRVFWTNPRGLSGMMTMSLLYVHVGPFSRHVIAEIDGKLARIAAGTEPEPTLVPASPADQRESSSPSAARDPLPLDA